MKKILFTIVSVVLSGAVSIQTYAQIGNTTLGTGAGSSLTTGDYNTFIGDESGATLYSGLNNTFIGQQAGYSATTSSDNTFIGQHAGYTNTTGTDNVFIGKRAGYLSTATDNTFIGVEAGESNTSGSDNTFIGEEAGQANTTGRDNVFVGEDAGFNNLDGDDNTFIGSTAGRTCTDGYRNTAVGNEAGYDITTGYWNTFVGDSAGTDCGVGTRNTMIGQGAGAATEHASNNTFVGFKAGGDNNRTNVNSSTNAKRNTYIGSLAGSTNRTGTDNVGLGCFADFNNNNRFRCVFIGSGGVGYDNHGWFGGYSMADANDVIVIGYQAQNGGQYGIALGSSIDMDGVYTVSQGYANRVTTDGDYGVQLGALSYMSQQYGVSVGYLDSVSGRASTGIGSLVSVLGDSSIAIGYSSRVTGARSIAIGAQSSVSGNNSIAIGYNVTATADNEVVIGNSATETVGGYVNWTALSDERVKTSVEEDVKGLSFINQLRPVTYNYDIDAIEALYGRVVPESLRSAVDSKESIRYTGFLAQDVSAAAEVVGYDFSGVDDNGLGNGVYGLRYAEFVVPLVKATQELNAKVEQQQLVIDKQNELLTRYEASLNSVKDELDALRVQVNANTAASGYSSSK
jgi:hypothetical protein